MKCLWYGLFPIFLVLCCITSCSIYDKGLLDASGGSISQDSNNESDGGDMSSTDTRSDAIVDASEGDANDSDVGIELCGNGMLDEFESCDIAIPAVEQGACPTECTSDNPCVEVALIGSDCSTKCAETAIVEAVSGDGCCPDGFNSSMDSDCPEECGNGIVESSETCDGECISEAECVSDRSCIVAIYSGSVEDCDASCRRITIEDCIDGDQCCPALCTVEDDDDCSAFCGDGVWQSEEETCDNSSSQICPTNCNDDQDCTEDTLIGNADNCSAACSNIAITEPRNNDGCCPSGANANNDNDCFPICGNGVTESGEECDDNNNINLDGCDDSCRTESTEQRCYAYLEKDSSDACYSCLCQQCGSEYIQCYNNSDPRYDKSLQDHISTWCPRVRECASGETGVPGTPCTDISCYCGSSPTCLFPDGPCRDVIEDSVPSGYSVISNPVTALTDVLAACASDVCGAVCSWAN